MDINELAKLWLETKEEMCNLKKLQRQIEKELFEEIGELQKKETPYFLLKVVSKEKWTFLPSWEKAREQFSDRPERVKFEVDRKKLKILPEAEKSKIKKFIKKISQKPTIIIKELNNG